MLSAVHDALEYSVNINTFILFPIIFYIFLYEIVQHYFLNKIF